MRLVGREKVDKTKRFYSFKYKDSHMLIYKEVDISVAHRILDYNGECENVHGHAVKVQVWLSGEIIEKEGLLADFKDIKDIIEDLDHSIVLKRGDPLVKCIDTKKVVMDGEPTCENLSKLIYKRLDHLKEKNPSLKVEKVRVWENPRSYAEFYEEENAKYL
ncbi:MAG: 6-pyruvoyl tetrahydropterin synthase, QueD [Candidatus Methanolliviera sp. GoM_oil]|nr:MAG: 6-pyruvoyl tetrahydropterin synthase, QueD [Candidatus Methanolliviera sp. GoM_oil]